jgi:chemotaxis protein methyltransferase CheR
MNDFRLLRDLIERSCGIALGTGKAYLIETRLGGLLQETGCPDFGALYRLASVDSSAALRTRIIDAITTHETLWFRDSHPFAILSDQILPKLADELRRGRRAPVRIWSAACSTGQEPYSIAMTVQEFCRKTHGIRPEDFEIVASDVSPAVVATAEAGDYDVLSMTRGLPAELRDRYFLATPMGWRVRDEIRRLVKFRQFNLQSPLTALGHFDVVYCRYVAIYFADTVKANLYRRLAELLAPRGHLFVSAVESLYGFCGAFEARTYAGGTYYATRWTEQGGTPWEK